MKEFLDLAKLWRELPIVDDNFPIVRDRFDDALFNLIEMMPKIVCLCGSTRFKKEFEFVQRQLTFKGIIVLTVGCFPHSDIGGHGEDVLGLELKTKLDELHKRKIDLADEVFVVNVGGYLGESTKSEIEYAIKLGKPIRYFMEVAND